MGTLTATAAAAFERHYLTCDRCATVLELTEQYIAAMRSAAGELRAEAPRAMTAGV